MLQKRLEFIHKNAIYKDKENFHSVHLQGKIRNYHKVKNIIRNLRSICNQLYFGILVLASYCYCGDNTQNMAFFQNTGFKESNNMVFKTILE